MENNTETTITIVFWGNIGRMEKRMQTTMRRNWLVSSNWRPKVGKKKGIRVCRLPCKPPPLPFFQESGQLTCVISSHSRKRLHGLFNVSSSAEGIHGVMHCMFPEISNLEGPDSDSHHLAGKGFFSREGQGSCKQMCTRTW